MNDDFSYQANLKRGQLLTEAGHYAEATNYLRSAIEADPNQPQAYLALALAESERPGGQNNALDAIDRAMALAAGSAHILGNKAQLLCNFGRYHEALELRNRALQIDPNCYIALLAQTNAYTKLCRWPEAALSARRMLELNPNDASALNLLAQAFRFQDRHQESHKITSRVLSLAPEDAFGQANAGYDALKADDPRLANAHFLQALRLDPHCEYARIGLLQSLRMRVWIYRFNFKILAGFAQQKDSRGFSLLIGLLTVATGGAILGFLILYVLVAWTLLPISNFFLLFDPRGRKALNHKERTWASVTGGLACILMLALAGAKLFGVLAAVAGYLLIFAFFVFTPQWTDAWNSWKGKRALRQP